MRGIRSGSSVVLGIGLLVGSSIGVTAQSEEPDPMQAEAVAPTRVTGEIGWGRTCTGPDTVVEGDVIHEWNWDCTPQTWTASDRRLQRRVGVPMERRCLPRGRHVHRRPERPRGPD